MATGNTGGMRNRRDGATNNKQAQMLRQMKEDRRVEAEQNKIVSDYQNSALSRLAVRYAQSLLLILLMGIGLIFYISPSYLHKIFLRLYDTKGSLLKNTSFYTAQHQWEIGSFAAGNYVLEVVQGDKKQSFRIIKQ